MKQLTEKIDIIKETGVFNVDLSWLNNNYQRALASYVRKRDAYWLRAIEPLHRYGALVCFLWQVYQDTIDFAVDMYDKLINKAEKTAKKAFDEELKRRRKSILSSLEMFQTVAGVILDKRVDDENVRSVVFSKVEPDALAEQISQLNDWVRLFQRTNSSKYGNVAMKQYFCCFDTQSESSVKTTRQYWDVVGIGVSG